MQPFVLFILPWLAFVELLVGSPAQPIVADAEAGRSQIRRCLPCHEVVQELNKLGPHLVGVVGRKAANVGTFAYSNAMKQAGAGGLVWTEENLAAFLKAPKEFLPGTSMYTAPMLSDQAVADLIAFLRTGAQP